MSEKTVESFVEKLQSEGVEVGQKEAARIRSEAEKEKEEILSQARAEAGKIKSDAETEAENMLKKSRNELKLAARDVALTLKDALERALRAIVAKPVEEELSKPAFLQEVIKETVSKYAEADAAGRSDVAINLSPKLAEEMKDWAVKAVGQACGGNGDVEVKGTLKQAGFEYRFSGGTVEVTAASVVEILGGMLSEKLRETLNEAMKEGN